MTLEQWEQLKEGDMVTHKFTGWVHTVLQPVEGDLWLGRQKHRFKPDGSGRAPIKSSDHTLWVVVDAND